MRRALVSVVAVVILAGLAPAAGAETHDVTIVGVSGGFDPSTLTVALGDEVQWTNGDMINHTTTQSSGVGLWDSGSLASGHSFSVELTAAGTYPYHCNIHASMTGTVRVPVQVSLLSSGKIKVVVASEDAASGFAYDVQRRKGSGAWKDWKDGITKRSAKYDPASSGKYSFRARLVGDAGDASNWSPTESIRS